MTIRKFFSNALTAICFALKHACAGGAVILSLGFIFFLPMWTKLVYLDGRYMTPELGFWLYLINDLPAMAGCLVLYAVFACYREDAKKKTGAPTEL